MVEMPRILPHSALLVTLLAVAVPAACAQPVDQSPRALAAIVAESRAQHGVPALLSMRVRDFDLERAYAVQAALVREWPAGEAIAGFKSGFDSSAAQRRFGLAGPVFAVLPASARICIEQSAPCELRLASYRQPVFEIELALRVATPIDRVPATRQDLLALMDAVIGVVESAELGMGGEGTPTGADYVASNLGVRSIIVGAPRPLDLLDGPLPMALHDGRQTIAEGDGGAAVEAAHRLARQLVEHGYRLKPGQILMTGAVGGMQPGRAGEFVADFGELGVIRFSAR